MFQSRVSKILLVILLAVFSIYSPLFAQPSAVDQVANDFYQDGKSLVTSPFHWQKKDRIVALSFLAATSIAFATDEESQKLFSRNRTDFSNRASDFFRPLGDKLPFWVLGGMYATGLIIKDHKAKETAYLGLRSILISGSITTALKYGFGRARPFGDKGAYYFKAFDFSPSGYSHSLPSGHATAAFAFASVIAHQYPRWWVKYPVYFLAAGVAWSRLNDNVHFTSDVLIGGAIGYFVGEKIVHRHQKEHPNSR
jgi:hypothetical protein